MARSARLMLASGFVSVMLATAIDAGAADAGSAHSGSAHTASAHSATATGVGAPPRKLARGPSPGPTEPVEVVQTDPGLGQYLMSQPGLSFSTAQPSGVDLIDVDEGTHYQQFRGIGASMTDSSAWLIYDELYPRVRSSLMADLFSPGGENLDFLRVPIGASDFTRRQPYTYDDMPPGQSDPSLSRFSIAHDTSYTIPALREALAVNPGLEILANPWSPPGWMKSNDSLNNINDAGSLLSSAYQPLASYFVKFIQAYTSAGVPIDAITPQNEPRSGGDAGTAYPGLTLPESAEATFITQNLKPALSAAGLNTKIYGNDLSWSSSSYADDLASGPAGSDLTGISWHCYFGSPTAMSDLNESDPTLDQIVDECSPEIRSFGAPEFMISSLRNWASIVAVWNIALDPNGGPKQAQNGCPGCKGVVTIDEQTHNVSFGNEYYQMGQVSRFVHPGATRIDSGNFVTYGTNSSGIETISSGLDDVAFQNPDGSKVLVAFNNSGSPISFAVESDGNYFSYTIPSRAMTTFAWK